MLSTTRPVCLRILVVLLTFTLVLGSACSAGQTQSVEPGSAVVQQPEETGAAPEASAGLATSESNEPSKAEAAVEVRFQGENFRAARYPSPILGSISFVEETGAAVEQMIAPGDGAVELQTVDGAGATWTLEIPAGALDSPQTIKMIPLSGLEDALLTGGVGTLVSGVKLEPDGLTFLQPLRLSVRGEALPGTAFVLSGSQDGGEVAYTVQDTTAAQPTARLLHFSTYFASDPEESQLAEALSAAAKEYQRLAAEADQLLKSPLDLPTPPSIPLECDDGETGQKNSQLIQAFVANAQNPEADLIGRLLEQRTIMALAGEEAQGVVSESDLEPALARRLGRKVTAMLERYQGQEEKLAAVSEFALDTARQLELFGTDEALVSEILNSLAAWNRQLIDTLIQDIRENHDYKRIPVVWTIAYNSSVLADVDITEGFLEELKNALRFEVQLRFEVNMPNIYNLTETVVPVQFEPENGLLYTCTGEGTGRYLNADLDIEEITVAVAPFPVQVQVHDFDPCSGTVTIGVDRFGSDSDTMTSTSDGVTYPWTISRDAGESLFSEEKSGDLFWFELPVENGNATAVDETIGRVKHEIVEGTLTIRMTHK